MEKGEMRNDVIVETSGFRSPVFGQEKNQKFKRLKL